MKGRNCEEKLHNAVVALSEKRKITPETPLDKRKAMNTKSNENKAKGKIVSPEKSVSRNLGRRRKKMFPYQIIHILIEELPTQPFFLPKIKKYVLPNPAHKREECSDTYSIREAVLYLQNHNGCFGFYN